MLIIFVFILAVSFGTWLALKPSASKYDERTPKETEAGGPDEVLLSNSETLSKMLLPKQFDVTKGAINDFVKTSVSQESKEVTVVDEPQINEKGVITLKIQVDDSSVNMFNVTIDKWTYYNKLIFSVPEKSYSVTLSVYSN